MNDELQPKKKMRSPNFPVLSLEKSIELSRVLYEKYGLSAVAYEVAVKGLNYSPKSSSGLQLVGALSAFCLIEVTGSGAEKRIKLSDIAYRIIEDKRIISPERDEAIKEAALSPTIFRKIKEDFPDRLPPTDSLSHELKFKYSFNPNTVLAFISVFSKTMEFAKVYQSGIIGEETTVEEESPMIAGSDKVSIKDVAFLKSSVPLVPAKEREIANYPAGRGVTLRIIASGEGIITVDSINKLIQKLELDKEYIAADLANKNGGESNE
jgi:hypothetical protein